MRSVLLSLALLVPPAPAALPEAEPHQPMVAGLVLAGLGAYHYAPQPLDDELSACWYESWLDNLDPDHSLFLQSDLAEFARWETRLDDLHASMRPDLGPAWVMFERAQQRSLERVAYHREQLGKPVSFTVPEEISRDPTEDPRPADRAEQRERWRQQLKHQRLLYVLDGEDEATAKERISNRLTRVETSLAETESDDILEVWLSSLSACFDPHTSYFRPASADDFQIATSGTLEGIGAALSRDGDYVRITEILAGGPADRSGELVPEDRIVGVAQGKEGEMTDVIGMRLDNVVQLIRGPKGTVVRLEILPAGLPGSSTRREVVLVRDRIDLEAVEPTAEVKQVAGPGGTKQELLVIEVPAFAADPKERGGLSTSQAVRKILEAHPGVDGVVVDLRENGGGYLDEAINLAGLFIDRGPVVQARSSDGRIEVFEDEDRGRAWSGPVVVLTSPLTASASEIFAAAIQDYGLGVVVGSGRTYGKGTVQSVIPLDPILASVTGEMPSEPTAGMMKVTTAQYYRIDGRSPQAMGVLADIVLPSPYEGRVLRESEVPRALPADTIRKARYGRLGDLSQVVPQLRERSTARVVKDARIQAIQDYLAWVAAEDEEETVSLVQAVREAEREEAQERSDALERALGQDPEARRAALEAGEEPPEQPEVDPILDEAVQILADLVSLSG